MGKANKIDAYVMYSGNSQHIRVKIQNIRKSKSNNRPTHTVRTEGPTHSPVINTQNHASGSKQPIGIRIQMRPSGRAAKMSLTCQCQSGGK